MRKAPEITQQLSIRDLKRSLKGALAMLKRGPVLLIHRREPVGVMVSYEEWQAIKEHTVTREELDDIIAAYSAEAAIASGEESVSDVDLEELGRELGKGGEDAIRSDQRTN